MKTNRTMQGQPFWQAQYQQWQSSDLSKAAFCRKVALNVTNFYYWCKKFETANIEPVARTAPSAFIPLSLAHESTPAFSLKVADVTVSCNQPVSSHQLREWLGVIRGNL